MGEEDKTERTKGGGDASDGEKQKRPYDELNYSYISYATSRFDPQNKLQEEENRKRRENVKVVIDQKEDRQLYRIKPEKSKFPLSIVWTPLPFCTLVVPFIGHTGIGDAKGTIHDFGTILDTN